MSIGIQEVTGIPLEMSADQFSDLIKALSTQQGSNSAILVFSGIVAITGILAIVWWVLNLRLKPLEDLSTRIDKLNEALVNTNAKIGEMNAKMWSSEALDNKIKVLVAEALKEHETNCPLRQQIK